MTLTTQQQRMLLLALLAVLAGLVLYRVFGAEPLQTAPLAYPRGIKMASPVRRGLQQGEGQDALSVFLARRIERYPGMHRDLFRVHTLTVPVHRPQPVQHVETVPTVTGPPPKSPEEIAAEAARADLSTFRFLGYLTDRQDKESSLFLSKSGELFIAKSGDTILRTYKIKSAGKDFVILYDTATKVEVRVDLTGGDGKK